MIDMLKYAKNLKNFKVFGVLAFFVSELNISVEILNIKKLIDFKPMSLISFQNLKYS